MLSYFCIVPESVQTQKAPTVDLMSSLQYKMYEIL